MIRIQNLKLHVGEEKSLLIKKVCKKLNIDEKAILSWSIFKESLDARKKDNIFFIYTIDIEVKNEDKLLRNAKKDVSKAVFTDYTFSNEPVDTRKRPVIIGFGPSGMFAALTLCQMGFKPIVLERGKEVEKRVHDIETSWQNGTLNINSNVQFGEGGAGTFSDGKLTARSKDTRCKKIFADFVEFGAPEEIIYSRNPHIGTDKLRSVVRKLRETIISMGAEVRFESTVTDFLIEEGKIKKLIINGKEELPCEDVILAIGHSARDTFEALYKNKVSISQKPFAMGVRIEHLQKNINVAQFGEFAEEESLGKAEYKLTHTTEKGRGVYTFCMCPGGYVVMAASEEGMLAVNGMSYYKRDGDNANSALLVQIEPKDFNDNHPLAGMYLQREIERKAFIVGGGDYKAPAQLVGDFLNDKVSTEILEVKNSYRPNIKLCDLNEIFPEFMTEALKEAIVAMGKKLKGFDDPNALLTAVESRSSSPIRIERNSYTGESINIQGLFPIGEGAGYAGGIVSAAVDGVKVAEIICEKYRL